MRIGHYANGAWAVGDGVMDSHALGPRPTTGLHKDDDGQPISVRYHEMASILLNELQKLSLRVNSLESELTSLRNK